MSNSIKNKIVKGFYWSSLERLSVQGIQFVIMIIMARLLLPSDYGLIGLLTIFLAVAQSIIDSGFSQALIRKQNRTEKDNSTVFYFNLIVGFFLYVLLYVAAPYVARFYDTPQLTTVMRVMCLGILLNSLAVVQRALFTVAINFKTQAKAAFIAAILSGLVGIGMAYAGYGVWALVVQQLVNLSINTGLLWVFSKWRPLLVFSWQSFHDLFSFGSKLLVSGLLDTIYKNIHPIVIGKLFSTSNLGYYTRAHQFSEFPSSNATGIIQRVTYPVLCSIQGGDEHLAAIYRRIIKVAAYVIFPMMLGLSALAVPFVQLTIGAKWAFSAQLLQIICFAMMWYPVHAINLNLLQVKGRSDLFLRIEVIKKFLGLTILCLTAPFGLLTMCYGQVVNSFVALVINTHYTGKLIHVGFFKQMKDLLPTFLLSLSMFGIISVVGLFILNPILRLIVGSFVGVVYYFSVSYISRYTELKEIVSLIKR